MTVAMGISDVCLIFFTTRMSLFISPCTLQGDGFEYVCMLGGATLPAPYNATDGSVACTVGEDEVQEFTCAQRKL